MPALTALVRNGSAMTQVYCAPYLILEFFYIVVCIRTHMLGKQVIETKTKKTSKRRVRSLAAVITATDVKHRDIVRHRIESVD